MYQNVYHVICDSCSEPAVSYDNNQTSAGVLDGKVCHCQNCTVLGRVSIDADWDGEAEHYVNASRFVMLTPAEISCAEFGVVVGAYEAAQKKIDEQMDENYQLRQELSKAKKGVK